MLLNIGIFLLLLLYLLSGYQKIINFNKSVNPLKIKFDEKFSTDCNIYFYKFLMILTIFLLILGSILLLCVSFILFTLLATYVVHWPAVGKEYYQFLINYIIHYHYLILFIYYIPSINSFFRIMIHKYIYTKY